MSANTPSPPPVETARRKEPTSYFNTTTSSFKHMVEVCFMKHNLQRADEKFKVIGGGGGDP